MGEERIVVESTRYDNVGEQYDVNVGLRLYTAQQ
jgi:hypothetical protein